MRGMPSWAIATWDIKMNRFAVLAILGSLGMAAVATPSFAGEALPPAIAHQLDAKPAEFTASAAKMRRMQIIQDTMARQRGYGGRGRYYSGGPRYDRGPRYGRPGGPPPGYYRRGYDGPAPGYYR